MLRVDDSHESEHELVRVVRDHERQLTAVIAVHSTRMGPAMGGVRRRSYRSIDAAIADALRLSRAMTLKNVLADLPFGGGKSVIVDAASEPTGSLLDAFGDAVAMLDGRYVAAEDMGTTPAHMDRIATRTSWVAGRSPQTGGSGDPSPATATTVFGAIRATVESIWGRPDLDGRTIGVLGVGKVGTALAKLLARAGARQVLADIDPWRAYQLARILPRARATAAATLPLCELDVLAPCAAGGVIDADLAGRLRAAAVCGAANNILADDAIADVLARRGITYVPDVISNSGGIIHVAGEFLGWSSETIARRIEAAVTRTADVLREARARAITPLEVVSQRAASRLQVPV